MSEKFFQVKESKMGMISSLENQMGQGSVLKQGLIKIMESLQSLEDMRLEFERLEAEESEIDLELGELIKQQPNLLIKGKFS